MDKNNPSIVAMCGFTSIEHAILGSCIGQNFGNCWSPLKFKPVAIAHQQWTHHLWMKGPKDAMDCATSYIKRIPVVDPISKDPPVKAQKDAVIPGVFDSKNNQLPPSTSCKSTTACSQMSKSISWKQLLSVPLASKTFLVPHSIPGTFSLIQEMEFTLGRITFTCWQQRQH